MNVVVKDIKANWSMKTMTICGLEEPKVTFYLLYTVHTAPAPTFFPLGVTATTFQLHLEVFLPSKLKPAPPGTFGTVIVHDGDENDKVTSQLDIGVAEPPTGSLRNESLSINVTRVDSSVRTGGIVNNILDGKSDLTVPASIPSFLGIHELSTLKSETVSRKSFALQDKFGRGFLVLFNVRGGILTNWYKLVLELFFLAYVLFIKVRTTDMSGCINGWLIANVRWSHEEKLHGRQSKCRIGWEIASVKN
ncbi:serine/threonine-protein kinase max-2 isoform X2 [Cucumis melo var. makuwa]|uniref:Serine/threonine-protein kinase max-2 isoform X2 n=1 Tax=Cucumis melo var. makuwa TaxID=1194695 RepID=A0A5D3BUM3_CUCMM|nr:serine/threonine-protein kinase max-2 isoform X2 [Cucumis melo var. makuwa]